MEGLKASHIKNIFIIIKEIMIVNEGYLFDLDSKLGDGDLGITMKNGFTKVGEVLKYLDENDIGKIFNKVGITLASTVPSTLGTLLATGFMRAGKEVEGQTEVNLFDFSKIFSAFIKEIMIRGKSKPGEKTIIDTMLPAAKALEDASIKCKCLVEAFNLAFIAALNGLDSTKNMTPLHGKAFYHKERSEGIEDPGAAAGMLIFKSFYKYFKMHIDEK